MQPDPILWFKVRDRLRRIWAGYLSTPTLHPMLSTAAAGYPAEAYTESVRRQIIFDIRYPWKRLSTATLPHELAHVALDEREIQDGDFEEGMVVAVSVPLFALYSKPPFGLTVPAKPEGYKTLHKWALRQDGPVE